MTPIQLSRLLLVLSAALYVGCSPAGNEETKDSGAKPTIPTLEFSPGESLEKFILAENPVRVPEVVFTDETKTEMQLRDFQGQIVLLNFWATWCGPCKHEMPSLDRLQASSGSDKFMVMTMSNDRAGAIAVDPYFAEKGFKALRKFYDPKGELARALNVEGLPTTILIDANGYELGRIEGPAEWDSDEAIALVDTALKANERASSGN